MAGRSAGLVAELWRDLLEAQAQERQLIKEALAGQRRERQRWLDKLAGGSVEPRGEGPCEEAGQQPAAQCLRGERESCGDRAHLAELRHNETTETTVKREDGTESQHRAGSELSDGGQSGSTQHGAADCVRREAWEPTLGADSGSGALNGTGEDTAVAWKIRISQESSAGDPRWRLDRGTVQLSTRFYGIVSIMTASTLSGRFLVRKLALKIKSSIGSGAESSARPASRRWEETS